MNQKKLMQELVDGVGSQAKAAELLGVTQGMISKWLAGVHEPGKAACKLAHAIVAGDQMETRLKESILTLRNALMDAVDFLAEEVQEDPEFTEGVRLLGEWRELLEMEKC